MFKFILNVLYYGIFVVLFLALTKLGYWANKYMVKAAIRELKREQSDGES
jgi:hypothetical protein